ncbi:hypothetical protein L2E82_17195 [Cichorium intybus]|uniref:Uncharacterized protein n=1 Tax=Cichorium intybus TaxID=13427 RepID=A0ACB9F729_CICIN|nr:hypothetical protein L2E82_17195 [Cichorium intybus]
MRWIFHPVQIRSTYSTPAGAIACESKLAIELIRNLDDFELPDNGNLQRNRSHFKILWRVLFTPHPNLEEMVVLIHKHLSTETTGTAEDNTLNSDVDPQASFQAKTPLKDDEDDDAMSDDDGFDQMDDSDGGDANYVPYEYAEGPCTPGLWEEPNLPNIQETPTCDEESMKEKVENASEKVTEYVPHQQEKSTPVVMGMEHTPMVTEYVPRQQETSTPVVMGMEETPMVTEYVARQQEKSTLVVMGMEHMPMVTEYVPHQQQKSTPVVMGMEHTPMVTEYVPRHQEKSKSVVMRMEHKPMVNEYVPHQQEKSTPEVLRSVVTMSEGHEGVKETFYENAIDKGRGVQSVVNDNRENWVKVQEKEFCKYFALMIIPFAMSDRRNSPLEIQALKRILATPTNAKRNDA